MGALSGRRIMDVGTSEADWQAWGYLAELPAVTAAGLLGEATRMVCAAPHPDDEVLGCGGLIAMAVAAGIEVVVVSITDGEACYPGSLAWPSQRLRQVRVREQERAMAALGVSREAIVRFRIPDGTIAENEFELRSRLLDQCRSGDLILVPWQRDGHPDHEATARACLAVAATAGARVLQCPIWAWHWARPDGRDFASTPLRRLALTPAACAAKHAALACFESQYCPESIDAPILPSHVLQRFKRPFEAFFHE